MDHQRYVHDRVPQGARPEAARMLAYQVPSQKPAVRAARDRHTALVHKPCMTAPHAQRCEVHYAQITTSETVVICPLSVTVQ